MATIEVSANPLSACLTLTTIDSLEDLLPYRQQIDALSEVPFLKCSWMFPWIETYCDSDCQLRFVIATNENSKLVGFAPLILRESLKRGRHYCFVGSGKACADFMTFPVLAQQQAEFMEHLARWLLDSREWDRVELVGATADDPTLSELASQLRASNCLTEQIPSLTSWRTQLPDSWDSYLAAMSKNSRKKCRRLKRSLEGKATFHHATDEASLRQGFEILESLHSARWESLGEGGCFAHQGFREFLFGVAEEKLASNSLSLIWANFEGQPFAADIAFYCGNGVFTYQGGISPEHLKHEPGRAILNHQIELAIDRGCQFMDFLRGDEGYKARFQAIESENARWEIVHPSPRGRAIHSMLQIGRAIKTLLDY